MNRILREAQSDVNLFFTEGKFATNSKQISRLNQLKQTEKKKLLRDAAPYQDRIRTF